LFFRSCFKLEFYLFAEQNIKAISVSPIDKKRSAYMEID